MAFYSLVFTGTVYGQQCQNQYNYMSESIGGVSGGATELRGLFGSEVTPYLRAAWRGDASQFTLDTVYIVDVYDATDFIEYTYPVGWTGLRTLSGPAVPPFVAYSYRTVRWSVGRNRGYKRYAGICEDDVSGNTYDPGGTIVTDIELALADVLVGALATYSPTIAGKEKYIPDPEEPLKYAYKYWDSESVQRSKSSGVIPWLGYRLTTQRSRIAGQGA